MKSATGPESLTLAAPDSADALFANFWAVAGNEAGLAVLGMLLLLLGAFKSGRHIYDLVHLIAVLAFAGLSVWNLGGFGLSPGQGSLTTLQGVIRTDAFTEFLQGLIYGANALALLMSRKYLQALDLDRFEFPVLVIFAGLGMGLMVAANDWLALYMAIELQSLALYVLAAFHRDSSLAAESGLKYFILGALSSGFFLFGVSLIYGFAGATDYGSLADAVTVVGHASGNGVPATAALIGLVFILASMAFKLSAAPFHMWTPDVYQGAPTPMTAYFAMVPKLAALGVLIRILTLPFEGMQDSWHQIIVFLSVASMVLGAFGALAQDNLKRLLAYSTIGHVGYALIGLAAGGPQGIGATLAYMLIYVAMTAGAFALLLYLRRDGHMINRFEDVAGLGESRPFAAYALAGFMLAMAGIPPLSGFFGKLLVFQAAVQAGMAWLAVIGVLTSVVAAAYYLRVIKVMFFDQAEGEVTVQTDAGLRAVLAAAVVVTLGLVLDPGILIDPSVRAAASLFGG